MPAPIKSRQQVVGLLTEVFREYGYAGTTLSLMSKKTGLVKASLYHYFPGGKQAMAEAVLEALGDEFYRNILVPLETEAEPRKALREMCDNLRRFYHDGKASCILELFSLGDAKPLFVVTLRSRVARWTDTLARVLLRNDMDRILAAKRAMDAVVRIEGALVVERAVGTGGVFSAVLADLPDTLLAGTD